ncbi:hypothetical protein [Actinomadura sp. WMMB 499]|uniref:hypothetical protein n=1 Tax=Actinomadura sp. WMMB 499 TaxID=1219491 RepID=UPI001C3F737D|nr:hypothetical protein [Actinomadura sp. WMMB 499]
MATHHEGDVSFDRLIAGDLARTITAVPQSLDNQWLDDELLAATLREGRVTRAISDEQQRRARREYLRSLLNAEKIVVNRAYLYNSRIVYQDFLRDGPDRAAFRALLTDGTILPYLMDETSPVPRTPPAFQVTEGFEGWRAVAETTPMSCLRLAWDDAMYSELVVRMSDGFENFLTRLGKFRAPALRRDLGLGGEEAEAVVAHLKDVAAWAFERTNRGIPVTRQMLYERFIVGEGGDVAAREYDRNLPHVAPLKQLFDLKYATNLADAVDVYAITPGDSPRRTALQEGIADRAPTGRRELAETDADQVVRMLRHLTFENVQGLLERVPSLDRLTLSDIRQVRGEREWRVYRDTFAGLLGTTSVADLAGDAGGAAAVTGAYLAMLEKAEEIHAANWQDQAGRRFRGLAELAIDIGALTINVAYMSDHSIGYEVVGDAAGMALGRAARVTVRLGLGRLLESRAGYRVENTAQILDMRMDDPAREAQKIIDHLARTGTRLRPARNGTDQSNEAG